MLAAKGAKLIGHYGGLQGDKQAIERERSIILYQFYLNLIVLHDIKTTQKHGWRKSYSKWTEFCSLEEKQTRWSRWCYREHTIDFKNIESPAIILWMEILKEIAYNFFFFVKT